MSKKVKAIHALNWFYGNYCTRKRSTETSLDHYRRMKQVIEGHEENRDLSIGRPAWY